MQENEDHGDVGVLLGRGHNVEVVVLDEGVGALVGAEQRRQRPILLLIGDQADELVDEVALDVAAVVPGDQDLALHVQEVDGGESHGDRFSTDLSLIGISNFSSGPNFLKHSIG